MNFYQMLYDLINFYVFNNSIVVGSFVDLWVTMFSLLGVFLLILLPFIVLIKVLKLLGVI